MATATLPSEQREHFHKLLTEFHTAMLVTHGGADKLRARPMAVAKVEEDDRVWFFTADETAKTHEIETDTRVHLVFQRDHSSYLSVSGHASLVHDKAKVAELWQESFKVWFPGGVDDPSIALIEVIPEEAEYWDNEGSNKLTYLYETTKAYLTGTVPNLPEGDQHGMVNL